MDWLRNVLERMPPVTPNFLARHDGREIWEIFAEMMADPHIQSVFRSRRAGVAGRDWEIIPADESSKAQKIAEFVRRTLAAIPNFEHALAHLLKAVPYGYSVIEIMWRIDPDGVRIDALRTRRPERFVYDSEKHLKLIDLETKKLKSLPDRKFVDHQHTPYACPLLYSLYWLWYFKKHAQAFWSVLAIKFDSPSRELPSALDIDIQDLATLLADLHHTEVSTVSVGAGEFYRQLLDFCNGVISERVLGKLDAQDISKVGSYEKARTYPEVDAEIIEQDVKALADTINFQLVRWLVDFNYDPNILAPHFVIDYLPPRGTPEFAQLLKTLFKMGYKVPERFIAETFGLSEEEKVMKTYNYLIVQPEAAGQPYHDDMYNERVFFIVPKLLDEKLGDFRVFNDWSFEKIDEVLSHLVPIFNYIEAHKMRNSPKP